MARTACGSLLALMLATRGATQLSAQCPDGTPPPCDVQARRATPRVAPPAERERGRRFLLLPFRNVARSQEYAWLVEGSPTMLADGLRQWQELFVVSDERLYPALRRAGLTPGGIMDEVRVRRVAEQTGGWTAVTGEVLATGREVRVSERAYDVPTGRVLVHAVEQVGAGEDIRLAYQRLAAQLLGVAGLDPAALNLSAATTPSLEAYRAYLRGMAHLNRSEYRQARAAFQDAVRLDSTFAQAYAKLAEASMVSVQAILDPGSPGYRYAQRAAELSARLPARQRQYVRSIGDMLRGQLTAARQSLERLVADDSTDTDAVSALAGLEALDPIMVPAGGGERRRGSYNAAVRLAKQVLSLDPSRHSEYSTLVHSYALAAGLWSGAVAGRRQESASLASLLGSAPDRIFVLVLRDTFELLPLEQVLSVRHDTIAALRRRALDAARAWSAQWLSAAPGEAEAHMAASRIAELGGDPVAALREIAMAESLGVESEIEDLPVRRMVLFGKAGRYPDALRLADSLVAAGYYRTRFFGAGTQMEGAGWAFSLLVLGGHLEAAQSISDHLTEIARSIAGPSAEFGAAINLCGGLGEPVAPFTLPPTLRAAVADTVLRAIVRWPRAGAMARCATMLVGAAGEAAPADRPRLGARALDAAFAAAAGGDSALAYRLAVLALDFDAGLLPRLAATTWYVERADEARVHTRFQPLSATLAGDSAEFVWSAQDANPFTWFRERSRDFSQEYIWNMSVSAAGREYTVSLAVLKLPGSSPRRGTLAELVQAASIRRVDVTDSAAAVVTSRSLSAATVRVRASASELRVVVSGGELVEMMRQERPTTAQFRIRPCILDPRQPGLTSCARPPTPVMYQ